ncbi:hypothetical protein Tco_1016441 [Tanacetum coccineum]|uniref:Uncharacterized protein n=1 Tax=Tanacetum coccineum TaxID=301880 RepID=A0ABQ5FNN0_9ASTR
MMKMGVISLENLSFIILVIDNLSLHAKVRGLERYLKDWGGDLRSRIKVSSSYIEVLGSGGLLDSRKEGSAWDKGSWVNDVWVWNWEWVRSIRGRVSRECEELLMVVQNILVDFNCRDKWRWELGEDGELMVKELARLTEEKMLRVEERLLVRVELVRRDVDLDSVLCPCCNNVVETYTYCLVTCDLAMSVRNKFNSWKVGRFNAFTVDELFSYSRNVNVLASLSRVWKAMDLCKVNFDNDDSGFETVHLPDDDDDSTLNNMPTTQLLETFIEDVINKKETLDSTMDKVTRLMIEVEREEKAAEEAKEEAIKSGFDILVKMDECKQAQRNVKETNDMLARKVCIQKAVLATKMEVLQRQAAHTLEDGDRSLEVLEEMLTTLEVRMTSAEMKKDLAINKKQENEAISQIALAHEELRLEKMVEESKKLKQEALEIHKELLVDRGDVVHMLRTLGGISAKCQDVNSVKRELDQVILSGEILSSTRIPSILALQSTIKTNDLVENSSESESEEVSKLHGSQMLRKPIKNFKIRDKIRVVSRK